jgi:dihydrofolate reductase (EC 1.5.1.3)
VSVELALIAAVAANGVIGREGAMPWHLPADLRRFKRITMGHPVVMGRRTFESISDALGGPLPGRTNIILSRRLEAAPAGTQLADSVDAAMRLAREDARSRGVQTVFIIGGAAVYEQTIDAADRVLLTELERAVSGDRHFPDLDPAQWMEVEREQRDGFSFVEYRRQG